MDSTDFIRYLTASADYKQQIVHVEHIPLQEASFAKLNKPLRPALKSRLESLGKASLYSHQVETLNAIFNGKNVILSTPTASGKTLCYQIATLDAILDDKDNRAIYLFPTKALTQDQLHSFREIACPALVSEKAIVAFDGDTPHAKRPVIKKQARILLTNPDMLHLGILPNHQSWSRLFQKLKYIVIDEAHVYRGVLGSHMANVLRRLRRVCLLYGTVPQFICCSATIANPQEHAQSLVGLPFEVIAGDGSSHGAKHFIFWNPPVLDVDKGNRRSANTEAAFLLSRLVENNIRSLVFVKSRKLTEVICLYAQQQLPALLSVKISPYRAGYLPEDRRQIEHRFLDGDLLGLVTTTALELGIDIGDLAVTVLTGYPGSISGAWQQAGRSGRGKESSLSILVAQDNPLDQYLMRNPEFFFTRNFDNALINPINHYILKPHLLCAAWEYPLYEKDKEIFITKETMLAIAELEAEGKLKKRYGKWYPSSSVLYPAQDVNIRATSGQPYAIVDISHGSLLETVEASVAFMQIHPGAIYLHQGESYLITKLDQVSRIAMAKSVSVDYYTLPRDFTDISITRIITVKDCNGVKVYLGDVDVTTRVIGYRRKRQLTEEIIKEETLDLPAQSFLTRALWFDLPQKAIDRIADSGNDFHGGLHACEHAAISILPLFALCDRDDIGGVSTPMHPDTAKPQIFIHDAYPGGIGIAEKGYEVIEKLWQATLKLITECTCQDGCPSCIQSPKCGNNNEPLDKKAAVILLQELVSKSKYIS
jgi:DEAD/DEAH box helicase domain-containing protein